LHTNVTGNNTVFRFTRDTGTNGRLDLDFDGANSNFNSLYDYTFQTDGTERMRINSSGRVGINETNPSTAKLVIQTDAGSGIDLYRSAINANFEAFRFRDSTNANTEASIGWSADQLRLNSTNNTVFTTGGTERMRITSGGNVLIGTTVDYSRLTVSNENSARTGITISDTNTSSLMLFAGNSSDAVIAIDTYNLAFKTGATAGQDNGTTRIFIQQGGNVGIGTTNPTSKLSIEGSNSGSVPLVNLVASGTGAFQRGVRLLNSGMNAGDHLMYAVGQADGTKNMGQFYFYYAGASSNSNRISMGLHSVDDVFNILGTGNVGIGTINPSEKLEVAGNILIKDGSNDVNLYLGNSSYGFNLDYSAGDISIVTNGTKKLTVDLNGNVIATVGMRAPIFYDSDDTNYYVDPASTSVLNTVTTAGFQITPRELGSSMVGNFGQWYAHGYAQDANAEPPQWGWSYIQGSTNTPNQTSSQWYRGRFSLGDAYGKGTAAGDYWMEIQVPRYSHLDAGQMFIRATENGSIGGYTQVGRQQLIDSRAPIFYDSNNTTTYLNPQSFSNLGSIKLNEVISSSDVGDARIGRNYAYNTLELKGYGAEMMIGSASTDLHINYRYCNNTGNTTQTPQNWYWKAGTSTTYSNHYWGNGYGLSSLRAPIFYDHDNTTYYTDPSYISSMYGVAIRGDQSSSDSVNQIFFYGYGDTTTSAIGFKSNAGEFTNPTGSGDGWNTYFSMDTDGRGWVFRRATGGSNFTSAYTAGWILNNGIAQFNSSSRAPIFYDSDNTGYYLDPTSYSQLNHGNFNAAPSGRTLSLGSDDTSRVYNDTTRPSLVINATYYPHLYINATTANNDNHGAVISMTGVLTAGGYRRWGMGIANRNPNALSWGYYDNQTNPHYGVGGDIGYTTTGSKMWLNTAGHLATVGSMRAPIFYDYDNTAYYMNYYGGGALRGNFEFAANSTSTSYQYASIELRESNFTANGTATPPFISFHWGGVVASSIAIEASGRIAIRNNPGTGYENFIAATISATGDVIAYSSSDERLKDNQKNIDNALEKVESLNGIEFDWNDKQDTFTGHDVGVIAQEVEKVLPEIVNTRDTGYKAVKYEKLVPLLIEAIKELSEKVKILENK